MTLAALPWLCLLLPLVAAEWCQVKHGKCTGQRHSFKERSALNPDLWERIIHHTPDPYWDMLGLRFADWDFDGDLDMIVAEGSKWTNPRQLSVLEQLANGSFLSHRIATVDLDNFAVTDWNGDGQMDVLVCHEQNETVIVSWFDLSPEVILNTSRDGDLDLILGDADTRYFERISLGEVIERQSLNPVTAMIAAKNESVRACATPGLLLLVLLLLLHLLLLPPIAAAGRLLLLLLLLSLFLLPCRTGKRSGTEGRNGDKMKPKHGLGFSLLLLLLLPASFCPAAAC
eukprot:s855_g42.t1